MAEEGDTLTVKGFAKPVRTYIRGDGALLITPCCGEKGPLLVATTRLQKKMDP